MTNAIKIGKKVTAISYGGGVQSTAMLVLAATGHLDAKIVLFSHVGADSENPVTLSLVETVYKPYAIANGLEFKTVFRRDRSKALSPSIRKWAIDDTRSVRIPIYFDRGGHGNRTCTMEYKIRPIAAELKRRGATKYIPATLMLGISYDEAERMTNRVHFQHVKNSYPLVEMKLTRTDCARIIEEAGLILPPKSSCVFCPFHSAAYWLKMRAENPVLFAQQAEFERELNANRVETGRSPVFLSVFRVPLDQIPDDASVVTRTACDIGGYCFS